MNKWFQKNDAFHINDANYMRFLIPEGSKVLELGCANGRLLNALKPSKGVGIDFSPEMVEKGKEKYPELEFHVADIENEAELKKTIKGKFEYIVLSDTIGFLDDCENTLKLLHHFCNEDTRLIISYYSHLWEPVLRIAELLKQKRKQPELNFLSPKDIQNVLYLSDFDTIKTEWRQIVPKRLLGLGTLINRFIGTLPLIRKLCVRHYIVARSLKVIKNKELSATVLIPCRNEKGNIEKAIQRMPAFCDDMEVMYVEGNSSDGTFEECERVKEKYKDEWDIKVYKQTGKGKGDAVRLGFDKATKDVLMILDADLTMPPEELNKYYDAMVRGKGEFVNGSRLVYPMEKEAMRFLNYWANRTFAMIFSFLLNQRFTDTLCGTKTLTKASYKKIIANRSYFGNFDPFGDFDLIFGAAKANLKIVEVPIRYKAREYGEPQISRFRDGFLLLRMVLFAWRKLKAF